MPLQGRSRGVHGIVFAEALAADILAACAALGAEFASRNIELVFGGGNIGIMGAIAAAVHDNGGKVIGVIPRVRVRVRVYACTCAHICI